MTRTHVSYEVSKRGNDEGGSVKRCEDCIYGCWEGFVGLIHLGLISGVCNDYSRKWWKFWRPK